MKYELIRLVGRFLLVLGGASGVVLFLRALVGRDKISEGPGMNTLWGLFVVGLVCGILIILWVG